MRPTIQRPSPVRRRTLHRVAKVRCFAAPAIVRPAVVRPVPARLRQSEPTEAFEPYVLPQPPPIPDVPPSADPYEDYAMALTREGGILITYKTHDKGFGQFALRVAFWMVATSIEAALLLPHPPVHNVWVAVAAVAVGAIVNLLIVSKPTEVYRNVEIRPDGMILDGEDTFLLDQMEGEWPAFQPEGEEYVLCGIYGTRFVEYLRLPRFDPLDRAPEVFAAHLHYAMQQMWTRSY